MPGDGHNKAIAMEAQTLRQELRADALNSVEVNGVEIVYRKQTWYLRQQVLAVPDWLEAAVAPQLPAPAGGDNMALAPGAGAALSVVSAASGRVWDCSTTVLV